MKYFIRNIDTRECHWKTIGKSDFLVTFDTKEAAQVYLNSCPSDIKNVGIVDYYNCINATGLEYSDIP